MAFWDQLKQRSNDMNDQLQTKVGQFKNKDFAKASMAMCALIAAADGNVDPAERSKVVGLISSNDVLKVFPAADLRADFDNYCDKLNNDYDFGKLEAIQAIGKLKKKEDQARAVVQVGIIIGGADGVFDENEKRAVRDACLAVGIDPVEFDLG
ncbi:tellurite resistance TerB family protein [Nocardioides pacificus]